MPGSGGGDGDAIKIFLRVRPPASDGPDHDPMCIDVDSTKQCISMHGKDSKRFTFDQVADIFSTQEFVFSSVGKKIIESCVAGYNGTIFAYGQTGSGKTFTMLGPSEGTDNFQHELRGVIPRTFEFLFNIIKRQQEMLGDKMEFLCKCTFLEIYNETVYDLLDPACNGLPLRENIKRGVFVDGLIEQAVSNASEAYQVLSNGWVNRTVAATSMNRESSRSHALFTVNIETKIMKDGVCHVKSSHLNLVDLAGSERQKDTNTLGLRLKEGCSINKSLLTLGHVIMALGDIANGKNRHVPYRDSKLTFMLKDSLGGNAKTIIISCVHPGAKFYGETLSTLQFTQRAKMIKNKAVVNEDTQGNVMHLQAEIRRLREMLAQYATGSIPIMSEAGVAITGSPQDGQDDSDPKWRKCFLEAMFFRERMEEEKKTLEEKVEGLEAAYNQNEKKILQLKMITKFKEEAVKKMERALKQKNGATETEKDELIVDLRNEIQALQIIVERPPETMKLKAENNNLRTELKRIKTEGSCPTVLANRQKVTELEKLHQELMESDKGIDNALTPRRTPSQSGLSVATTERHKTEISKLKAEIETLKRSHNEQTMNLQQEVTEKEAMLVSVQKGREELERQLKSQHVRAQIERQTMEETHLETLKNMTTPKKAKYQLRNRVVMVPGSGTGDAAMADKLDLSGTEDFIMAEEEPWEMVEEKTEALTEEIQKLQEENEYLRSQHGTLESQLVELVEDKSKLEFHKNKLETVYSQGKAEWEQQVKELTESLDQLKQVGNQAEESKTLLLEELRDYRVMFQSADKQLKEVQQERDAIRNDIQKELASLQTKLVQLDSEKSGLQKEIGQMEIEKTQLEDELDNAQHRLGFQETEFQRISSELQATRSTLKVTESNLHVTQTSLEQEQEKSSQLSVQLQEEGEHKENQLIRAQDETKILRNTIDDKQKLLDDYHKQVGALKIELEEVQAKLIQSQKSEHEKQDALDTLIHTVQDQKKALLEHEGEAATLTAQLGEQAEEMTCLRDCLSQKELQLEALAGEKEELAIKVDQANAQLEMSQEVIDTLNQSERDHLEQISDQEGKIHKLQEELELLKSQNEEIKRQHSVLEEEFCKARADFEAHVTSVEANYAPKDTEILTLREDLAGKLEEVAKYRQRCQTLQELCKDHEGSLVNRDADIKLLQEEVQENKMLIVKLEHYQNQCQDLHEQLELELVKESQYTIELQGLGHEVQEEKQLNHKLKTEVSHLQESLECVHSTLAEVQDYNSRLQKLTEDDQVQLSILTSTVEEQKELDSRNQQRIGELEEMNRKLTDENAHLAGHQNHSQKLQYVMSLKNEHNELKERIKFLEGEVKQYQKKCLRQEIVLKENNLVHYTTPSKRLIPQSRGTPVLALKENVEPTEL